MRITVGPPILTINHGGTFMVTDLDGQIQQDGFLGIFAEDTRFLSYYACYANSSSWVRLRSTTTTYYASRVYLTNPEIITEEGNIEQNSLSLIISRTVEHGIHEDLDLTNYGLRPAKFTLEIALRSDFADIFEVNSGQLVRRGCLETNWDNEKKELHTIYKNKDFFRSLIYQPRNYDSQPHYANGRINFEIALEPGESWHTCGNYILVENDVKREPIHICYYKAVDEEINTELEKLYHRWLEIVTEVTVTNEEVYRAYRQSVSDTGALRLYDYDFGPDVWLPAAGVPKFVTLFGRDSLIVTLQNMITHPGFARGTLKKLAQLQATEMDDWRDAQPGKILHEIRKGELAHFQKIPHTPYYGTADATTLYLIVLHEAWKWTGDDSLLHDYRDTILQCIEWIDRYGDLDGDGFQEYQTRSPSGIENQGWKDSGDAIVYPDGSQVKAPKALCELQGYVFDAWMRMAEIFDYLDECDRANHLRCKAAKLQAQFEETFWCEDIGFYALTLDPDKKPVRTVASNPGHCLWSGIVSPERAAKVVQKLLAPDMYSGWGIRTLSANNPAFNPFSYHRGSIWPHDNGIIALGLKRYGFKEETARLARDLFEATSYFASYRLPELYSGVTRSPGAFPVPYIEANVPQAWAAGSIFHLLQAILGLQADAPNKLLYVDPCLPHWIPEITLNRLEVGEACIKLRFWQEDGITRWDATPQKGEIEVKQKSWQPWKVEAD
ncbi:glycogen debranching N-terminal domain-containing protein [Gloeocapsopsis sp. IPPAS B-1203]|uniref:amylo-alpha-1,6-glucosidase n=1 Tax=Gloeocapsopsis sp. IPPAS B-1203 TaxID=2049454 RepID=UPI000C1A7CA6|nr:amylo-alpha-1,6-glucosidase [Gloeocapsopsis sp. IPPAS B-1203]